MRDSHARLAAIIESAMDAIITVDGDQRIVLFNAAAERMFRTPAAAALGDRLDRFIPQRYHSVHAQHISRFGATGVTSRQMGTLGELMAVRSDGEEFPIEASISQTRAAGKSYFTVIIRDITQRLRAENDLLTRARQQAVVAEIGQHALGDAGLVPIFRQTASQVAEALQVEHCLVMELQPDGQVLRPVAVHGWPAGADLPNFPAGADYLPGYVLRSRTPVFFDDLAADPRFHAPMLTPLGICSGAAVIITQATGRPYGVLAALSPNRRTFHAEDANFLLALANVLAATVSRHRAEAEIRALNASLERRVAERTAELEAKNRELETFTYSVSHDLKAPLRGIDGYSRLLLEDYGPRLDGDAHKYLTTIRRAVTQMSQLIDDLLAYSRIERRSVVTEPVDVRALVDGLVAERAAELAAHGVAVHVDVPCPAVTADIEGLAQALRNLLDNAIKFTQGVPQPSIEIRGYETERSCVVWVRDNGIGFDMQYHDRIFGIFQRLHRPDEYPGTGIGLAIVHKALGRMRGRVWAESAEGQGACFYLEIPR